MATWLTIEEAARYLKIGNYQMARDGKVPAQKLGRAWRFDVEDLDKSLKWGRRTSDSQK